MNIISMGKWIEGLNYFDSFDDFKFLKWKHDFTQKMQYMKQYT